ncbi:MAG: hypothetical protein MZV63_61045 [Marinilabiliales bacterium]|nr:hypothetical protein [Marinilabiliales bacterium]
MREDTFDSNFDIGGPDILTYKEMLLRFAAVRKLKRKIWVVPVMTPKLSSYWLYFVTSTSYKLAVNLVDSMKVEVICRENDLHLEAGHQAASALKRQSGAPLTGLNTRRSIQAGPMHFRARCSRGASLTWSRFRHSDASMT